MDFVENLDGSARPRKSGLLIASFAVIGLAAGWCVGLAVAAGEDPSRLWSLLVALLGALSAAAVGALIGRYADRPGAWGALIAGAPVAGTLIGALMALSHAGSANGPWHMMAVGLVTGAACLPPLLVLLRMARRLYLVREGSILEASYRSHVWFAAACLFALFAVFVPRSFAPPASWIALGASVALLGLAGAHAVRSARVIAALRKAEPPPEGVPEDAHAIDLGIGDERWIYLAPSSTPYRSTDRAKQVFRGSRDRVKALLIRATLIQSVIALAAVYRVAFVFPTRGELEPGLAHFQLPSSPEPSRVLAAGAWYPQAEPILTELGSDGVEDIIGLRWDSNHEDAALSVAANDGATLKPIWRTTPIRSQWSSSRTHLLMSADKLFLSDSEGMLHIYDRATGEEPRPALEIPVITEMCVVEGGEARVWIQDHDEWTKRDRGISVDGAGNITPSSRPQKCMSTGPRATPAPEDDSACSAKNERKTKYWSYARKAGDVGVIFGSLSGSSRLNGTQLWGYDPKTCKDRWESAMSFDDAPLHAEPRMRTELANGRVYGFYQVKGGTWRLGARDARTGEIVWHRTPEGAQHGSNFESMTVSKTRLYLAHDWRLHVFDAGTGEPAGVVQ